MNSLVCSWQPHIRIYGCVHRYEAAHRAALRLLHVLALWPKGVANGLMCERAELMGKLSQVVYSPQANSTKCKGSKRHEKL